MKNLQKILKYALNYKKYALLNIISNILSVIFELVAMLLFIPFLNLLFNEQTVVVESLPQFSFSKDYFEAYFNFTMNQYIADNDKLAALYFVCVLVGVMFLLKNLFRYLALFFIAVMRTGIVKDLRKDIYAKILILPLSYYSEEKKGDILSRITTDVQEIEFSILNSLEMLFREPISVILSLAVMIAINPHLTLFSLILLPITGLVIGRLGKSLKRSSSRVQQQMGVLLSTVEETLTGLRIIKAFNAEQTSNHNFNQQNSSYATLTLKMTRKRDLASPISEFLGAMAMVGLAYYGGSLVLDGNSSFNGGEFIGYIIIFAKLIAPVKAFSSAYAIVQKGAASADRVDAILSAKNPIIEKENPISLVTISHDINYKNVSFAYNTDNVLTNINLKIEKGKTIALVGESGGGKSTLADLLPRFYDVTSGAIEIDGVNIKDLSLNGLRSLIGVVTQESILFNDSVYNNIAFGTNNATKEQVIEAAKIANADEFIVQLESGYDTNIGDRGGKLSGGQRQRLSIARAVLKNPPILILDEATSALDTESEKLVQDALTKLMKNRTSIVIAHRLSTIQNADEIIVLQKGEIAERGTHSELLLQEGIYKRLSDLQTFSN
ncbi:MAG: ABC transporter ATP-binding protein [Flavobacteriales bacterium]|nr:ABC transporter ATP-binding protein [Flavobacteriales bacterium]MCB9363000.1 ABC transporter ATP-binding protein [Flavobacteriales bacterium]